MRIFFSSIIILLTFTTQAFAQSGDGSAGGTPIPNDPAPVEALPTDPASSGATSAPSSSTTASPVPPAQVAPKPATSSAPVSNPTPLATEIPTDVGQENESTDIIIPTAIGALVLGILGFFGLKLKKNKKQDEEKDKSKCLNLKKLMEEKLEELKDLKTRAMSEAESLARNQIRKTRASELLVAIETAEKEYAKLKKLYEECIAELHKSKTVFIFHGTEGYPEENWFPWLKKELEKRGHKVFVPQFPSPKGAPAKISDWFSVLGDYGEHFNEDMILIGHSLGGIFLLRILEKLEYPIHTAVFVGTPIGIDPLVNYERDKSFSGFDFDWNKIKKNSKNFLIFHSDNDPYVGIENGKELARKLGAGFTFVPNAGHFNTKSGYTKFEILLEKIKSL